MTQKILVTGAAGYIGGTVLAKLLETTASPVKDAKLWAAVRTSEQAEALEKLNAEVLRLDLTDSEAVGKAITTNEINIVVHTANLDGDQATNMIKALGQVRQNTGKEVSFFWPYVTSMFAPEGGWTHGPVKDTDSIHELQKQIGGGIPVRGASIAVVELGQELGVKTFTIPLPPVYGRGLGLVKKLSLPIPYQVRAAKKSGRIYRFEKEGTPPSLHVEDLADLYILIIEKILRNESVPYGAQGFYFPAAHQWHWWAVHQRIADSLHSRGIVTDPELLVWPNLDIAAKALGLPRAYVEPMMMPRGELVAVNAFELGWKPQWDEERFLKGIDAEVQDALDLDGFVPSAYDTMMND